MKLVYVISAVSLIVIIVVDFVIGSEAEFLNAFSVPERLLGRQPTAGTSVAANEYGAWGELCIVFFSPIWQLAAFSQRLCACSCGNDSAQPF